MCVFELRLERRLRVFELRADGMACRALRLDQALRVGVDRRHLLRCGELRFEARPRGGRFGFSRRDARQLDHQRFEGVARIGVRQRRFERRQPGVERGAKVLELSSRFGEMEPERGRRRPGIGFCEGGSAHLDPESGVNAHVGCKLNATYRRSAGCKKLPSNTRVAALLGRVRRSGAIGRFRQIDFESVNGRTRRRVLCWTIGPRGRIVSCTLSIRA